jgi:Lar family restriction alleviation protein
MNELKPCPFCGGKAGWMYQKPIGWVMCKKCGASSATFSDNYEEADFQQEAIAAWNRRVDAVPVARHGRWIKSGKLTKCSICGNPAIYTISGRLDITAYCSNCGAKMEVK